MNESNPPAEQRWRPTRKQIIAAIIVVAALLFIFQNNNSGHFHFLWFHLQAPVWLWLLVVFVHRRRLAGTGGVLPAGHLQLPDHGALRGLRPGRGRDPV